MGDAENVLPPSKKRVAGRELSRDNPGLDDEEDVPEQESGTFQKASNEVLATRRIVKVRRHQPPSGGSSNPFAAIRFVSPTESGVKQAEVTAYAQLAGEKAVSEGVDGKSDVHEEIEKELENKPGEPVTDSPASNERCQPVNEADKPEGSAGEEVTGDKETEFKDKKDNGHENTASPAAESPLSSFQQLSSNQNAFTGLVGTGFSKSSFSFGSIPKPRPLFGSGSESLFGLKNDKSSPCPSIGFGKSENGSSSSFATAGDVTKNEGCSLPSMQEVPVETGEENEKAVYTADAIMFEYLDGGWKERGKGEVKVNVSTTGAGRGRLVMRARGNYRLILNACLYPDMKLTNMEKRGITFACVNSTGEGKDGLSTFALKFKDGSVVEEFCEAITANKGNKTTILKTPENSPKASDD